MSTAKIKFEIINRATTSLGRNLVAEMFALSLNGSGLYDPPDILEAKNFIISVLKGYYDMNKKYWSHQPYIVNEDEKGVWLMYVKSSSLENVKICGFSKI